MASVVSRATVMVMMMVILINVDVVVVCVSAVGTSRSNVVKIDSVVSAVNMAIALAVMAMALVADVNTVAGHSN